MYTFQSRVRYSETDKSGFLSLNAVVNYMQDCRSEDHTSELQSHAY